jgi:hypothetical protein
MKQIAVKAAERAKPAAKRDMNIKRQLLARSQDPAANPGIINLIIQFKEFFTFTVSHVTRNI